MGGEEVDARIDRIDNKDLLKLAYKWDNLSSFNCKMLIKKKRKIKFEEFESKLFN